jgi:hypothetical protein
MDFRLKKRRTGHAGLNMGLFPGLYHEVGSGKDAIHIGEDPFWLLEPAIKKHCARYSNMAHYGRTDIPREEWFRILDEWDRLRNQLVIALLTTDIQTLRLVPRYARREFVRDFHRNCLKLAKMIGQLSVWMRRELQLNDHISIHGI